MIKLNLSPWIVVNDHCATRVLAGTDFRLIENRVAFIEKTARIRVLPYTNTKDWNNWKGGHKGMGGGNARLDKTYGFDPESRKWCDQELLALGYVLPDLESNVSTFVPKKSLYYECHLTLDPVVGEELKTLKALCEAYDFRVASLYLAKGKSLKASNLDAFTTGRSAVYSELNHRMIDLIQMLKASGFVAKRYKIESALLDSRVDDQLNLL